MEYIHMLLFCYSFLGCPLIFYLSDFLYDNNIITGLFSGILNVMLLLGMIIFPLIGEKFFFPRNALTINCTEIISGKQQLLDVLKIKSNAYLKLACIPIFMTIIYWSTIGYSQIVIILLLLGTSNILCGMYFCRGEQSLYVKRKHNVIELADDLLDNTIFQDEFIIISNKAIAQSNDITRIADRNDVIRYL